MIAAGLDSKVGRHNRRRAIVHFALIYFMLLWSQSTAFMAYMNSLYLELIVIAFGFAAMFVRNSRHATYWFMFSACYLIIIMFDRLVVGGTGLGPWASLSTFVVVGYWAVAFDPARFADRLVKVVFFLACVSVALYGLQQVAPGLVSVLLPFSYDTGWLIGSWSNIYNQSMYTLNFVEGMLFYTYRPFDSARNVGIFSEPANYQIVLNITFWLVMYMRDRLDVSDRRVKIYVAVLVIAILTTGSTSGYLVLSVQLLIYVFWGRVFQV